MNIKDIILKPVFTEKATNMSKNKFYSFEVNYRVGKNQIKKAIEEIFKVKVEEIKTLIRKGKKIRVGRRMKIKKKSNKKIAFIKLKEGKIDIFPQV